MFKTVATVTAAAVLLAFSHLFAQEPVPALPTPSTPPAPAPTMEGEKKGEPYEMDDEEGKGKKGKKDKKDK